MKELKKNFSFAWKYVGYEKKKVIGFIICSIINIIMSVIVPIFSARLIVDLTNNKIKQVLFIAVVLFLIEIGRNFIFLLSRYFSQVAYREAFTKIQLDSGRAILKLKNECIDANSSGVFIQRLTTDTSKIADVFNVLIYNMTEILTNIGIFGAIFIIDVRIFVYMLLMVLIIGLLERKKVSLMANKDKEFRKDNEKVSGFIGELVRGVRDIKMLSSEKSFLKELESRLIGLNEKRYDMGKTQRNYQFIIGSLRDLFDLTIICLLVYFIYIGDITIALALVVHNYMGRVTYIVNSYSYLLEGLKDFNVSASRIFDIINGKDFPKEKFGKKNIDNIKGEFEFKNVSFSYEKDNKILDGLSFKIEPQTTTAFVGKSGVGKSTIFSLLCKMYDIDSGVITIDGIDITELNRESIRDNITIISQNPYIFNVSIRDNLRLVKDDLTDEEMEEACKVACLDDFINLLPDGYDTIVGEGGISLSGGERQRVAIARALIQKTKIILFDEATSALDNVTQSKIKEAIENMHEDYTILIIAHRLSTIINSDRILFLDDGKVCSSGTHSELLKTCKEYKNLYEKDIEK